jgi:uncharacterized protein YjiS (DUF1127 family)
MTPVSIGELNTEVVSDSAPAAPDRPGQPQMHWHEIERARRALAELSELQARTRAEGFDG